MSQSLGETARNAIGSLKRGLGAFLGKESSPTAADSFEDQESPDLASESVEAAGSVRAAGVRAAGIGPAGVGAAVGVPGGSAAGSAARGASGTQLQFTAQGPQWGFASWQLSEADRRGLEQSGATSLSLRIADVTGLSGDEATPHAQQEVSVDRSASQWGMALPLADRDYRVDLGYHSPGGWVLLARSSVATIPGLGDGLSVPPPFTAFAQPSSSVTTRWDQPVVTGAPGNPEAPGAVLHEQLYQTATMRLRKLGRGSETFHELDLLEGAAGARASHGGLSDSGPGLWASGRNESGVGGVPPRQRSFWLVADAELIVYGATEPSATLKIGEEVVPLSSDGTFRIQVPFRDGQQLYPIEAIAIDGEQKRNIVLRFERDTPEDHTNPADEAKAEWF